MKRCITLLLVAMLPIAALANTPNDDTTTPIAESVAQYEFEYIGSISSYVIVNTITDRMTQYKDFDLYISNRDHQLYMHSGGFFYKVLVNKYRYSDFEGFDVSGYLYYRQVRHIGYFFNLPPNLAQYVGSNY